MKRNSMSNPAAIVTELGATFTVEQSALDNERETRIYKKLLRILKEIRVNNNLEGYVIRNSTRAMVDINNPAELADLALIATQLFEVSTKLLSVQERRHLKNAILDGSRIRVLCVEVGGNQVSVFMDKTVNCEGILERISKAEI